MTQHRLGRKQNHDPRSLAYLAPASTEHRPVRHRLYGPVLNQGNLGSCVGNALSHALNSKGSHRVPSHLLKEDDAVELYYKATAIDPFPGQMPQEDTGTDVNSACHVARDKGLLVSWSHVFGLDHFLGSLQLSGLLLGITWDQSMFDPDADGFVHPDGNGVGGHEIFVYGDNPDRQYVEILNSWGTGWAKKGRFKMTYADLEAKLKDGGDATAIAV